MTPPLENKNQLSVNIADPNPAPGNLQPATNLALVAPPVSSSQAVAIVQAQPLLAEATHAVPATRRKLRRHGRIASLPRLQRDMVNRMLWNGVPYKNIVAALSEAGYNLTERNVSNWATGGHLEWRLEQEAVLDNRLDQDQLLNFLRRDDAPELPEVGLQAAATRLSQVLLHKLARADDPEANLDNYSRLIDLLCRLNREISSTQKQRDDSRRTLGREFDPVHVKEVEQVNAIENERFFSDPPAEAKLAKPAVPPLLPEIPTATFLAKQAEEERHEARLAHLDQRNAWLKAVLDSKRPAAPRPSPAPESQREVAPSSSANNHIEKSLRSASPSPQTS